MARSKANWTSCQKCSSIIPDKSIELHTQDCPPALGNIKYGYVRKEILYSILDIKQKTGKVPDQTDVGSLVFLSESVMKLCSLAIGDWALLKSSSSTESSVVKMAWPTFDKSLTSVLLTKEGVDTCFKINTAVTLERFQKPVKTAKEISVVLLKGPKGIEITKEITNRLCKKLKEQPLTLGNKVTVLYYGKVMRFQIKNIKAEMGSDIEMGLGNLELDECFFKPSPSTKWTIYRNEETYTEAKRISEDLLSKIGGLGNEISELKDRIQNCFDVGSRPLFASSGNSVLLYGNSGTGKTLLAEAVAQYSKANIVTISPASLYSSGSGNAETFINNSFEEAAEHQPSVIIIDGIDVLCPSWSGRLTDSDKRISATLLKNLDNLNVKTKSRIFVIATSSKPDAIDAAFRRCGILDSEIEVPVPNPKARKEILLRLLKNAMYDLDDESLDQVASNTHGFVGADLVSLCSNAAFIAKKRNGHVITVEDFKSAQKLVKPSAMREVQIEVPNVKWSDIGGQEDLKLILKQAVEWPLKYPQSFTRLGVSPPRGVLMYGPPGCSKTMIAKALATESGLNFLSIKGPELFSKWVGESERAVREVFRKARQVAPSIIFFDEIDALGGERTSGGSSASVQERVLAQLLTELDGVTPLGDVTVVAATNRPDRIDKALLRPGRLDRIVHVPLPDQDTRRDIFRIKLSKMPILDVDIDRLVTLTDMYSGAEINAVCHEAAMAALEDDLQAIHIESRHFEKALKLITPRTPASLLQLYKDYKEIKV